MADGVGYRSSERFCSPGGQGLRLQWNISRLQEQRRPGGGYGPRNCPQHGTTLGRKDESDGIATADRLGLNVSRLYWSYDGIGSLSREHDARPWNYESFLQRAGE